jgi:endonuclease-3
MSSEILVDEHGGIVPADMEALEALPGVGHKTASVVLIQAFDTPAFPVDTHIHRLAARWGLSDEKNVDKTERDLKAVFPREAWARLHLSMIYFGREFCPARGHDLATCPICSWAASKKRMAEEVRTGGGGPRSREGLSRGKGAAKKSARKKAAKKASKKASKKAVTK